MYRVRPARGCLEFDTVQVCSSHPKMKPNHMHIDCIYHTQYLNNYLSLSKVPKNAWNPLPRIQHHLRKAPAKAPPVERLRCVCWFAMHTARALGSWSGHIPELAAHNQCSMIQRVGCQSTAPRTAWIWGSSSNSSGAKKRKGRLLEVRIPDGFSSG